MSELHTILIKKSGNNQVVDTKATFGIATSSVPFKVIGDSKELPKRVWYDEHGEDTFIGPIVYSQAYDMEITFAYCGQELKGNALNLGLAKTNISNFVRFLNGTDGNGASLTIFSPYTQIGRQKVYFCGMSEETPTLQLKGDAKNEYNENCVTFKSKFRVTDPVTDVVLS